MVFQTLLFSVSQRSRRPEMAARGEPGGSGTAGQSGCPWPRVPGGDELCSVWGAAVRGYSRSSPPAAAGEVRGATRPHVLEKQPRPWVAGCPQFPGVSSCGPRAMPILSGSLGADCGAHLRRWRRACRTPTARSAPPFPPALVLLLRALGVCPPPHTGMGIPAA